MYYIGFLKKAAKYGMIFKSIVKPKKDDLTYFVKVIGPYPELKEAQMILNNLKYVGWHENPVKNPFIAESQIRIGAKHELEHTTDRSIARKIACDHLKDDPKYYTHLAKMEKMYKKNVMSADKALRLTKKVVDFAKDIHKEYKSNPGAEYHDRKFLMYMKELEKYKLGSPPYIATLAKAYEHLESAKESAKEVVGRR